MTHDSASTSYNSLAEIRARREALGKEIEADGQQIKKLWGQLFAKDEPEAYATPSKRLNRLLSTGAGMFDAALLGWKLYRKFSGKPLFSKKRRW